MIDFDHNAIDELLQSRVRLGIVAYHAVDDVTEHAVLFRIERMQETGGSPPP